ncbi:BadF/BadG/BcrA/BcrD ATPase family protein [Nonomuraea sp. NPDC050404]|uniref:N-acetylglucosamine kinase n=1 Tax=Nonomuraea sp. NPDC050404 TaxID=3155783 RepID=UPI0033E18682
MDLVLGVDAGGTSTRAALFTLDGRAVRRGHAAGANPVTLGMERAAAQLTAAVGDALAGVSPSQVKGVVAGVAGSPEVCAALTERVFRRVLPLGVAERVPVRAVGDIVTAFASGTSEPSGSVLISGTGAIAAKIIDHRAVAEADGYGWLLGDEGSAYWLGHAAARTTIRHLAARGSAGPPPNGQRSVGPLPDGGRADGGRADRAGGPGFGGGLVGLVVRRLLPEGVGGDPVSRLAAAVHARPPLALAELAPLVSEAAAAGDPLAMEIVREAAERLVATLRTVQAAGPVTSEPSVSGPAASEPVVLAGSVLTAEGPVQDAVRGLLGSAAVAGDAAGAAAWLAARPFLDQRESRARHQHFTRPAR